MRGSSEHGTEHEVSKSGKFHLDFQNNNFHLITIIIIK